MMTPSDKVEYPTLTESVQHIPSAERVAEMIDVNMEYAKCYLDGDFDGMFEYLVDVPEFEFHPPSIRVTGRDAVRERSRRMFQLTSQNDLRKGVTTHRITAATHDQDTLVHEFSNVYTFPGGTRRRCYSVAVIPFVGDKMVGERIYSDTYIGGLRAQLLGEDFYELPGVVRLCEPEDEHSPS